MSLTDEIVQLLNDSHIYIWKKYKRTKEAAIAMGLDFKKASSWRGPGEPALTYGVMSDELIHGVRYYLTELSMPPAMSQPLLTFGFIHQKPKVLYTNKSGCNVNIELGDILIIRHHFVYGKKEPEGRAFILQAKAKATPTTGKLSSQEIKQLELYEDWSLGFIFPNKEIASPRSGGCWDFSQCNAGNVEHTGIYGVVLSTEQTVKNLGKFPRKCVWGIGLPKDALSYRKSKVIHTSEISLADAISGIIMGDFGRPWVINPKSDQDHWSEFINNILVSHEMKVDTSLKRIGEDVPRIKNAMSLIHEIPGLASLATELRYYYRYNEPEVHSEFKKWIDSVSDEHKDIPPGDFKKDLNNHNLSGMSFLYISTFGCNSLKNVQEKSSKD